MENNQEGQNTPTAFLVDLVSNRKIPVATPRCRVGRDDLNDIVISGDQSISRFHFIISYENGEFTAQDAKSRHGTFLNGNQITSPEPIKDGDVLKVGVSLFWFVVEAASEKSSDSSPIVGAIEGQEHKPVVFQAGEVRKDAPSSKDHTQEMAKPDANLMDKLEQAANSIQLESKTEAPKASLASLLQPFNQSTPDSLTSSEDDIKSKLAAKDKELLAEASAEEAKPETSTRDNLDALPKDEGEFPKKVLNKPSDTVTLAAMPTADNPQERLDEKLEDKLEDKKEKVIEPPKLGLANLFTQVENAAVEQEKADRLEKERLEKEEQEEQEREEKRKAESISLASLASAVEDANNGKSDDTLPLDKGENGAGAQKDKTAAIAEQSQTGEITVEHSAEVANGSTSAQAEIKASGSSGAEPESSAKKEEATADAVSAELQEHVSSSGETVVQPSVSYQELSTDMDKVATAGASTVPDWCKQYFSDEIGKLNKELDELNDQVRLAQQKIRDVETRVALTKGIRNTLLTTTGDELVEAAGKVLGLLGWKVTIAAEDKHELRLEAEEGQVCIARVIWTTTQAERAHLGQLSISQTRYWCEKGQEPKGILIVSKIGDGPPSAGGNSTEDVELADYASKKNVCLMTTLQLLSLYKEVALNDAKPDALRNSVAKASGWLDGHNLEPGTSEPSDKDEAGSNKLSSLLSA